MSKLDLYGSPKLGGTPVTDVEEHAIISDVAGKKVFNVNSSGNLVNPATSENQAILNQFIDLISKNQLNIDHIYKVLQTIKDNTDIQLSVAYDDANNALNIIPVGGTISTVGSVSDVANIGSSDAYMVNEDLSTINYSTIRNLYS